MNLSFVNTQLAIEEIKNQDWESIRKILYVVSEDKTIVPVPQFCADIIVSACKRYSAKHPLRKIDGLLISSGCGGIKISLVIDHHKTSEDRLSNVSYYSALEAKENLKSLKVIVSWRYCRADEFKDLNLSFGEFHRYVFDESHKRNQDSFELDVRSL